MANKEFHRSEPVEVTVRCTTYNHEPYVRQCLEGFVMQKTNFRFEVIVHDDASTDHTADIIREYAAKFPDIIKPILQTENQWSKHDGSIGRILNEHCRGKYVANCEGDDFWIDPLKLQKQYDFLETHPDYSMCCHNAIKLFMDTNTVRTFNEGIPTGVLTPGQIVDKWIIPTASMFYRIENLQYPEWLAKIYSGDMALYLRCMNNGRIFYSDSLMSVYRYSTKGMTASSRMKGKEIFIKEQQTMLLESFNKGTNYRFDDVVGKKIKENYSFINYLKTINKSAILGYFTPYFIGKVINKIARIIKKK